MQSTTYKELDNNKEMRKLIIIVDAFLNIEIVDG